MESMVRKPWYGNHGTETMVRKPWYRNHGTETMVRKPWYGNHGTETMVRKPWFLLEDISAWFKSDFHPRHITICKIDYGLHLDSTRLQSTTAEEVLCTNHFKVPTIPVNVS